MGGRRKRDKGLIVLGLLAALLVAGGIYAYVELVAGDEIPTYGPSMKPTFDGRADVEVDEGAYEDAAPERGDIVTAQAPEGVAFEACAERPTQSSPCAEAVVGYSRVYVLKRVIAVEGDSVAFDRGGHLILDGETQEEPYILPCPGDCALPDPIEVGAGEVFLAGDNREVSSDSRSWGPVPITSIDGRVELPAGVGSRR
ncbi:signal peptidase I [Thermoleophilia bacterium SCSIO 60948]|nr:signal peptidase I [Thermoleophilia bacterium SCSIO 60948]